jgi:hypothetical protein
MLSGKTAESHLMFVDLPLLWHSIIKVRGVGFVKYDSPLSVHHRSGDMWLTVMRQAIQNEKLKAWATDATTPALRMKLAGTSGLRLGALFYRRGDEHAIAVVDIRHSDKPTLTRHRFAA